jgi:peptide/nickel transport system substrate-binding protein
MKKLFFISLMVVLVLSMLVSGCSKSTPTTTTAKTSATTSAGETTPQGELIYAVPSLGSEDFGFKQSLTFSLTVPFERLLRTNIQGVEPMGVYPLLADSYTASDDGLTYDFYLHQGVQWQKGWGEFTADDVVFTFYQIGNPELQNSYSYIFESPEVGGYLTSVEAVDRYHVRFNLSCPYNMLALDLTDGPMWMVCKKYVEEVGWDAARKAPIGTSPWEWVETVPGDHIKFQAVDNHWRKTPEFKYLTFKLVPDLSTELMMLQTGEADMAILSPGQAAEALGAGLQLLDVPNVRFVGIEFGGQLLSTSDSYDPTVPWAAHTDEPDSSDWNQRALKVREALCLSINPQAIIDKIMYGYAHLDVLRDYNNSSPNYLPEWTSYPYDPDKARALLAEAGYADGFDKPIQALIPSAGTGGIDTRAIMMVVADDFEAIGLNVDRQIMDQNLIDDTFRYEFDSAWKITVAVGFGIIEPMWGATWSRASFSPMYEVGMNPTFDAIISEYMVCQDSQKLVELEQELGTYEYNNYIERGLFDSGFLYFFGPKVKNASQMPLPFMQESVIVSFFNYEDIQRAD